LKGEERVCHVTEADTPGRKRWMCPKKCLHARPLGVCGSPLARGCPSHRGGKGVLPLCAAALRRLLRRTL
jgi:hypothetical protein